MLTLHVYSYVRWMAIRGGIPTVGVYVKCYCSQKNKCFNFHKTVKPDSFQLLLSGCHTNTHTNTYM